ncbi:asparagine synthase-related protein [Nocardia wallacei]|uniref:asparagine synthase-related protein n=1 Tax=Nocardia wallacei TaxID=480035 RepID=UPI00245889BB|nr:asparagine synthase-related protein [Nocardia wallacei]
MLPSAPSWFLVLADGPGAEIVADRVRAEYGSVREISHPSGRPWIIGHWEESEVAVFRGRDEACAAIGEHDMPPGRLDGLGAELFGRATASAPGSFHVIGSRPGRVRVRGTASGLRRVFHAVVDGVRVASDRADVLATLARAEIDRQQLALLLLYVVPWPLPFRSVWSSIEVVWPGHTLEIDHHGHAAQHRWWRPPAAELTLAEGAELLRARLREAVELRTAGKRRVASDLGGVDSTALCSLAARSGAEVVAITATSPDDLDDDIRWARDTVAGLGSVEHVVVGADELPLTYDGIRTTDDRFDEPCIVQVNKAKLEAVCHRSVDLDTQIRFVGFGGDEILRVSWGWLHATVRRDPLTAIRTARRWSAKHKYPLWRVGMRMAGYKSYREHLTDIADNIVSTPAWAPDPAINWGFGIISPPWLTTGASETVRDAIRECAKDAEPLAQDRGLHQTLEQLHGVARGARLCQQFARRIGVPIAAPYLDDSVVGAALSVRPPERVDTGRYKPLLAEAMAGIVPETSRHRGTKANTSAGVARGLRRHRGDILALLENSRLAELGIIDSAAVRDLCAQPLLIDKHRASLDLTIAVEAWLRGET